MDIAQQSLRFFGAFDGSAPPKSYELFSATLGLIDNISSNNTLGCAVTTAVVGKSGDANDAHFEKRSVIIETSDKEAILVEIESSFYGHLLSDQLRSPQFLLMSSLLSKIENFLKVGLSNEGMYKEMPSVADHLKSFLLGIESFCMGYVTGCVSSSYPHAFSLNDNSIYIGIALREEVENNNGKFDFLTTIKVNDYRSVFEELGVDSTKILL